MELESKHAEGLAQREKRDPAAFRSIQESLLKQVHSQSAANLVKTAIGNDAQMRHEFVKRHFNVSGVSALNIAQSMALRDWATRDTAKQYIRAWVDAQQKGHEHADSLPAVA